MGLDMYLYRQRYFSEFNPNEKAMQDAIEKISNMRPTYLKEQIFYWRKANQIRDWFARKLGTDDRHHCTGRVTIETLRTLLETVVAVMGSTTLIDGVVKNGYTIANGVEMPNLQAGKRLEDPTVAQHLLPTSEGFFFGSTDYDQWYWQDLQVTKDALETIISDHDRLAVDGASIDYIYDECW